MALSTGAELSKMFNKNVTVVHNPTDSALIDLVECIFAKLWAGQSYATSKPCSLLLDKLLEALQDTTKTKVRFDSHTFVFGVLRGLSLSLSVTLCHAGR